MGAVQVLGLDRRVAALLAMTDTGELPVMQDMG